MTADRLTALRAFEADVVADGFPADLTAVEIGLPGQTIKQVYAAFSGSLDAAMALHDAVLPGWDWAFIMDTTDCQATVRDLNTHAAWIASYDKTPARAWLLAIIRALIWQEENRHD